MLINIFFNLIIKDHETFKMNQYLIKLCFLTNLIDILNAWFKSVHNCLWI
ncbi:hypothetical protein MCAV_05160 [[Mycoplasma] cavipharyngis]